MGLMDRAKEAARHASDVAERKLDEAKDAGQRVTLKRKLSGLAAELGDTVFRQRAGEAGLDAEVDRLIAEMQAVKTEMDALAQDDDA